MSCSTCVTSLAGFGQDDVVQASPEVLSGIKTGIASFIGGPIIGSFAGLATGAIAWKDHRVLGGVLGFFGGGILGSVVGLWLAKRAIAHEVIPGLEKMGEDFFSGGSTVFSVGPNSAGPADWTQPVPLPSGKAIPTGVVVDLVSKAIGAAKDSAMVQAATSAVAAVSTNAAPQMLIPTNMASRIPTAPQMLIPTNMASRIPTPPQMLIPTNMSSRIPAGPTTQTLPPQSTNLLDYLPGGSSATTSDPSSNRTTLLPGQTMPMLR